MSAEREFLGYRVRVSWGAGEIRYLAPMSRTLCAPTRRPSDAHLFLSRRSALRAMADLGGVWAHAGRIVHVYRRAK